MIINKTNLDQIFNGFKTAFNKGVGQAPSYYKEIAMTVSSTTAEETYPWLGQLPGLREWIGDRHVKNLSLSDYSIKNRLFEDTISVPRTAIEDDNYGVFSPLVSELGRISAEHPDELIFGLLAAGFATLCYDGQYFFDTDHPVDGESVSNMQAGSEAAWYLMDTSRSIKPLLFQERSPYQLTSRTSETEENVFMRDEYQYGVRGRSNVGFGLWQLGFGSKATLDAANYAAARSAMMTFKSHKGRLLGIKPDTLIVPPSLESAALQLVQNELIINNGVSTSNEWAGTAKLIVCPWLA